MFGIMLLRDDVSFKYLKYERLKKLPAIAQNFLKSFKEVEYNDVKILNTEAKIAYIPNFNPQNNKMQMLKDKTVEYFKQSGIQYIFAHPALEVRGDCEYDPKKLLFSLLPDILKTMFNLHNIKVTIIQKELDYRGEMLIKILSPQVKYIDLMTQSREYAQRFADNIYDITGLAMYVTDKLHKTDKDAVIILDNMECRFHREAIIFDLSNNFKGRPSNRIISRIAVEIPQELIATINSIESRLDKQTIQKIILTALCKNACSANDYVNIRKNFYERGLKIQGMPYPLK